jgi:DNA-binding NtrC family response regulator
MERDLICRMLEKCRGNKSRTAQMHGLSRKTLYEKLDRHT